MTSLILPTFYGLNTNTAKTKIPQNSPDHSVRFIIPRIFRRREINMEDLSMEGSNVRNSIIDLREKYAQENFILFLPFRLKEYLQSTTDNT